MLRGRLSYSGMMTGAGGFSSTVLGDARVFAPFFGVPASHDTQGRRQTVLKINLIRGRGVRSFILSLDSIGARGGGMG